VANGGGLSERQLGRRDNAACQLDRTSGMSRVIAHRVLIAIPVLLFVSILTFVLVSFLPGDAARAILGREATPEQVAQLRAQLGLNQPLLQQYWHWLSDLAHGSLGNSLASGESVTQILNVRLPVTLVLVISTTVVSAVIGTTLGFVSAVRGGPLGRLLEVSSFAGFAFPAFWIALMLVALFAVKWQLLPPNDYVRFTDSPSEWIKHLILPVAALSIGGITGIATQTRDSTLDALGQDVVRVQFANGFSRRSIAWKHVLRNAAPAVVTVIGLVFVGLLSGAVIVETIFTLPGLGDEVVSATTNKDIPVVQGAVLYFTVTVLIVNLIFDILHGWADPRVRVR
jgi:peptide/nickel transport system permease protein